ncbi:MAG: DoxX family protein [Cytophagales bacterium]
MNKTKIISIALRLTIALIFIQTLYFKFTAHPESVNIFAALNAEPYGRIGLGIAELITSILLFFNRTMIYALFSSIFIILGAIISHFMVLGINVMNDGGNLFLLAITVLLASLILLTMHRKMVFEVLKFDSK